MKKKKKRIIISVTNDLVTDQRVNRIANTLYQHGYDVLVVGRKLKDITPLHRPYRTKRLSCFFYRHFLFYLEFNTRLFFFLIFHKADIFLSNDTDTLPANYFAALFRRKKLVFDAHEMFPEVPEVVKRPFIKKIWTKIENFFFPKLKTCYTVCQSIADIYNQRYGINMSVVRNISVYKNIIGEHKQIFEQNGKKILLYQGAVNIGRGIEWMIDAMPFLDNMVFYVIGDGDILQKLKSEVEKRQLTDKVVFCGRVPFESLHAYTIAADLGINLLENKGLNYYYSLPNRIFDFMHARVPVIATDFPEIRKVVGESGIGTLIDSYEPSYLAEAVKQTLAEWENKPDKCNIFDQSCKKYNWENEEKKILNIFNSLF